MPVLKPFIDMVKKYGTPYVGGAFCTDRLKLFPSPNTVMTISGEELAPRGLASELMNRSGIKPKPGIRYLAELSDFEKGRYPRMVEATTIRFAEIPEHLGNCIFCIKKSTQKIGLACKDEEGLQRVFNEVITGSHVRDGHRETPKEIMYRGRMSLDGIAKMYSENHYQALYQDMVRAKRFDTGSCSESCEIFGGQLDFDFGREAA